MPRCIFNDYSADRCENEALADKSYCQLHQDFENDEHGKLNHIISVVSEIQSRGETKKKDFWDKLSASATLFSGLLIGLIGIFATATYNNRELESQRANRAESIQVRRVEIVQKFFPHLVSPEDREQKGALLAIASLGDERLATKLAQNFASAGSVDALRRLASSSDPTVASQASAALDATLLADTLAASTVRVQVSLADEGESSKSRDGTGFIISTQGHVLTAAHLFPESVESKIAVSIGDQPANFVTGHAIQIDRQRDIALVRLKTSPTEVPPALELQATTPRVGSEVFTVGFRSRSLGLSKVFGQGKLTALDGPNGSWVTDLTSGPGASGAPVANSEGKIVGYLVGVQFDQLGQQIGTMVRPISEITDILKNAGVNL